MTTAQLGLATGRFPVDVFDEGGAGMEGFDDAQLIADYRRDMIRRGLLFNTWEKRVRCLRLFALDNPLQTVTREELEAWLDARGLQPKSRYAWISHLHSFYAWAFEHELLQADPTARIDRPRLRRSLPRPIPDRDLVLALAGADQRMKCWLLLGAYQGLRCQEIAGLEREDVIDEDLLLRVVEAKGGHERIVPLHPEVLHALRAMPMPRSGALFIDTRGGRMTPGNLGRKINNRLHTLGIDSTAHTLRHWFGTNLYQQTHDLRLTQEVMGHQSPTSTAIYTAFDRAGAQTAVQGLNVLR